MQPFTQGLNSMMQCLAKNRAKIIYNLKTLNTTATVILKLGQDHSH